MVVIRTFDMNVRFLLQKRASTLGEARMFYSILKNHFGASFIDLFLQVVLPE